MGHFASTSHAPFAKRTVHAFSARHFWRVQLSATNHGVYFSKCIYRYQVFIISEPLTVNLRCCRTRSPLRLSYGTDPVLIYLGLDSIIGLYSCTAVLCLYRLAICAVGVFVQNTVPLNSSDQTVLSSHAIHVWPRLSFRDTQSTLPKGYSCSAQTVQTGCNLTEMYRIWPWLR